MVSLLHFGKYYFYCFMPHCVQLSGVSRGGIAKRRRHLQCYSVIRFAFAIDYYYSAGGRERDRGLGEPSSTTYSGLLRPIYRRLVGWLLITCDTWRNRWRLRLARCWEDLRLSTVWLDGRHVANKSGISKSPRAARISIRTQPDKWT